MPRTAAGKKQPRGASSMNADCCSLSYEGSQAEGTSRASTSSMSSPGSHAHRQGLPDRRGLHTAAHLVVAPVASATQGLLAAAAGAGITLFMRRAGAGDGMASMAKSSNDSAVSTAAAATTSTAAAAAATVSAPAPPAAPSSPPSVSSGAEKPAHDVVAGAMARAASQSTVHPLDTMKVRMQAGSMQQPVNSAPRTSGVQRAVLSGKPVEATASLQKNLTELRHLYKGVAGAATGAGIIIGTYFAFYSTAKRFLR